MDAERVSVRAIETTHRGSNLNNSPYISMNGSPRWARQYSRRRLRSFGVEVPLLLQLSIALFTGMVAATFVPPVRKAIPRPAEAVLWAAFITVCVLGVMSVSDKSARDLSMATMWASEQVVNTILGLLLGGAGSWIAEHRFAIASWLVVVAGADVLALMLIRSMRSAAPLAPRVRLGEWMELPLSGPAVSVRHPAADPLAGLNRALATATAILVTRALRLLAMFSVWLHGAAHPQGARTRRDRPGARSRLESLRDAMAHLNFAVRTWYDGAGQPALSTAAATATEAATRTARTARRRLRPAAERAGQVIDIRTFVGGQSLGWYGPIGQRMAQTSSGERDRLRGERDGLRREMDEAEAQRPDSLAS